MRIQATKCLLLVALVLIANASPLGRRDLASSSMTAATCKACIADTTKIACERRGSPAGAASYRCCDKTDTESICYGDNPNTFCSNEAEGDVMYASCPSASACGGYTDTYRFATEEWMTYTGTALPVNQTCHIPFVINKGFNAVEFMVTSLTAGKISLHGAEDMTGIMVN